CFVFLIGRLICLPALLAQDTKTQKDAQDDLKLLQGSWKMAGQAGGGIEIPQEAFDAAPDQGRWLFKGSELQIIGPGKELQGKCSMKLDSSKTPKHIDLVGSDGSWKGKSMRGIFKFEKDLLVFCFAPADDSNRPEQFFTAHDCPWFIIKF